MVDISLARSVWVMLSTAAANYVASFTLPAPPPRDIYRGKGGGGCNHCIIHGRNPQDLGPSHAYNAGMPAWMGLGGGQSSFS